MADAEHPMTPTPDREEALRLARGYDVPGSPGHVNVLARALLVLAADLEVAERRILICPFCASGYVPNPGDELHDRCAGCRRAEAAERRPSWTILNEWRKHAEDAERERDEWKQRTLDAEEEVEFEHVQFEKAERERDELQRTLDACRELTGDVLDGEHRAEKAEREQLATVREVREWLRMYGEHRPDCAFVLHDKPTFWERLLRLDVYRQGPTPPCDCGYWAALRATEKGGIVTRMFYP